MILSFFSCEGKEALDYPFPVYSTEASEETIFMDQVLRPSALQESQWDSQGFPGASGPRAGTVSHHLLASGYIDRWFSTLAKTGNFQRFFILSPRHFNQGTQSISLSPLPWDSGMGLVPVDKGVLEIKRDLNLPWDPWAFHREHGIGTLVPFIKKFFPQARIIPMVLQIENRDLEILKTLARKLSEILKSDPQSFLIISTDFSHHADLPQTQRRDQRTKNALKDLNSDTYLNTYSDNVSGFAVLGWVLENLKRTRGKILAQANSFELTQLKDDITSYFFTFY